MYKFKVSCVSCHQVSGSLTILQRFPLTKRYQDGGKSGKNSLGLFLTTLLTYLTVWTWYNSHTAINNNCKGGYFLTNVTQWHGQRNSNAPKVRRWVTERVSWKSNKYNRGQCNLVHNSINHTDRGVMWLSLGRGRSEHFMLMLFTWFGRTLFDLVCL